MDEKQVYRAALEKWGADAQTLMAFEEMAELQKELCKAARGKDNAGEIAEEIADVEIMLGQMKILHGCAGVSAGYKRKKLERLVKRCGLDMDGEPEPVKLGAGVSLRLENTSVSTLHGPQNGVPVEIIGQLKNLCEFCREMERRGGIWAEHAWDVDAAALEIAVAILSELEEMKEVHIKETPEAVELESGAVIELGKPFDLEALIRKTVAETFKAWTATAKDGGCIVITEDEAAEIEQAVQEAGPGAIVNLEEDAQGTASATAAWKVLQALGYANDTPFKETQDFLRKAQEVLEILEQAGIDPVYWKGTLAMAGTFDIHMRG